MRRRFYWYTRNMLNRRRKLMNNPTSRQVALLNGTRNRHRFSFPEHSLPRIECTRSYSSRRNIWRSSRSSRTCSGRWPAPKPLYGCHRDLCSCFLTVYNLSYSSRRNIWKSSRNSRRYSERWPAPKPPFCSGSCRRKPSDILKNSRCNSFHSRKASIRRYG